MKPLYALVLSHDAVAAAVIGAAAELAGLEPAFAAPGEHLREALRRLRPMTVIADCDHDPDAGAFVGPAAMVGARVAFFCSSSNTEAAEEARELAERYDLAFFLLPEDTDALQAFLDQVARDGNEPLRPAGGSSRG